MREPYQGPRLFEQLRPQASPVDTYVVPEAQPHDTSLGDLANGLRSLSGSLSGYLDEKKAKQAEEDAIRAEADFHANNRTGYAEAVAQGIVPAQASRAYVDAYKKVQGDVAGYSLTQKFQEEYDAWGGKGQGGAAFDTFLSGFISRNLKGEQDPQVLAGLLPRLRALAAAGVSKSIDDQSRIMKQKALEGRAAQVDNTITGENTNALATRKPPDWDAAVAKIMAVREEHLKVGGDAEKIDRQIVDAITARARQMGTEGPKLLDKFFNSKVPGKDYTWGSTPYGRDEQQKAVDAIDTQARKDATEEKRAKAEQRKAELEDVTRKTIDHFINNPKAPLPDELMKKGVELDGDFKIKVIDWAKKLEGARTTSDPEAMLQLHYEILNGGGISVLRRAMDAGVIRSVEDLKSLNAMVNSVEQHKGKLDDILGRASTKSILNGIRDRSKDGKFAELVNPDQMSDTGLRASTDFRRQLMEWVIANPQAGPIETEEAIAKIGGNILKQIAPAGLGTGRDFAEYGDKKASPETQPAAPLGDATQQPKAQAPQQGQQPTQPQQATPNAPNRRAAMEWLMTQPPETRSKALELADKSGKSLEEIATSAYERGLATGRIKPPGSAPEAKAQKMSFDPANPTEAVGAIAQAVGDALDAEVDPQVVQRIGGIIEAALGGADSQSPYTPKGNFNLAVLRDDPRAARILDFVAGPESKGNYNAYFGNVNSQRDLSQYSVKQVMDWARTRGTKSSATGRYQFMYATVMGKGQDPGLLAEMGLTGNEKFTPELQDKMAVALLQRRGYDEWRAGKMSTKQFALNLAKEWASLPHPDTGRSYYDGDGLNKSLVSYADVQDALHGQITATPAAVAVDKAVKPVSSSGIYGPGDVYANMPDNEVNDFIKWNPDPVGNHEKNLGSIDQTLASVVRKAQKDNPALRFVVGSGKRDDAQQREAVKMGWSKTEDSDHKHGGAADLWPLDAQGRVKFDPEQQKAVAAAMKKAAKDLGVDLEWGGDWRSFKDLPHFGIKGRKA